MANVTRYIPMEDILNDITRGFCVSRSFSLPTEVDDKATVAKYQDGVLDLTLPKKAGGSNRRISVQ